MTRSRLLALLTVAGVLLVTTYVYRERARVARMEAISAGYRELAATRLAPEGSAPRAGISARAPIAVRPFPDKLARQLHDDADFHHLVHRCGVCHSTPDPTLHTMAEWDVVLDRMAFNIQAAGLLPLKDEERAAVRRALERHRAR